MIEERMRREEELRRDYIQRAQIEMLQSYDCGRAGRPMMTTNISNEIMQGGLSFPTHQNRLASLPRPLMFQDRQLQRPTFDPTFSTNRETYQPQPYGSPVRDLREQREVNEYSEQRIKERRLSSDVFLDQRERYHEMSLPCRPDDVRTDRGRPANRGEQRRLAPQPTETHGNQRPGTGPNTAEGTRPYFGKPTRYEQSPSRIRSELPTERHLETIGTDETNAKPTYADSARSGTVNSQVDNDDFDANCKSAQFHLITIRGIHLAGKTDYLASTIELRLSKITSVFIDMTGNPMPIFTELTVDLLDDDFIKNLSLAEMENKGIRANRPHLSTATEELTRVQRPPCDLGFTTLRDEVLYIDAHEIALTPPSTYLSKSRLSYVLMAVRGARLMSLYEPNKPPSRLKPLNIYWMGGKRDVDYLMKRRFNADQYAGLLAKLSQTFREKAGADYVIYMGTGSLNPANAERHQRMINLQQLMGTKKSKHVHSFNGDFNLTEKDYDTNDNWKMTTAKQRYTALTHYIIKNQPMRPVDLKPVTET